MHSFACQLKLASPLFQRNYLIAPEVVFYAREKKKMTKESDYTMLAFT
jgi:hypothetical protein